jgi:hypothetical protein
MFGNNSNQKPANNEYASELIWNTRNVHPRQFQIESKRLRVRVLIRYSFAAALDSESETIIDSS